MAQQNEIGLSTIGENHTSEASQMLSVQCERSGANTINYFSTSKFFGVPANSLWDTGNTASNQLKR